MKPFNEHGKIEKLDFKTGEHLHGDVIIRKIKELPKDFESLKKEPNDSLAYGEAHGHFHKLFKMTDNPQGGHSFDLREIKEGKKYLKVIEPVILKHQEHAPRIIPEGDYEISIQREYDPFTKLIRKVTD